MAKTPEDRIERFARALESALGANLVSLVLYGSAARDQHVEGRSDLNLLVIVRDASTSNLHPATSVLAEWIRKGETPPLIFSETEWRESADVFPIEIEDMRDARRVVLGRDPVSDITTQRADLREELEHEVRGKLLRLRTEYAATAHQAKGLARLLENSFSTFQALFRATLRLKGITPPREPGALIQEAARVIGIEAAPYEWARQSRAGLASYRLQALDRLAGLYVDGIEKLARVINDL